jgi:hypothetical protein
MYPFINIRTYTYTPYTHKLFVHYTVTSLFSLRNQTGETIIIYIRSFLSDVHIFFFLSSTIYASTIHPSASSSKKKGKKKISYVLMITMMIYMFYTLLLLEKFNNEMYSSMPTIGEIEAGGENEERKNKE